MYIQAHHKQSADLEAALVHYQAPARQQACTATPLVKGSWRALSLVSLGQWQTQHWTEFVQLLG